MKKHAMQRLLQLTSKGQMLRVWQQDQLRVLDFDDGLTQSAIELDKPQQLPLILNRAMLAGSLFSPTIESVLLAGTGGGATARFLADKFPEIRGEAVEFNPAIAAIAKLYFAFPAQWSLQIKTIQSYVLHSDKQFDLIVLDIAEHQRTPDWLLSASFLQQCRKSLSEKGHLALNLLVEDASSFLAALSVIRGVFDRQTVCLSLPQHRNIVVLAFNQPPAFMPPLPNAHIQQLSQYWSLEFPLFYQQMQQDNPLGSGLF